MFNYFLIVIYTSQIQSKKLKESNVYSSIYNIGEYGEEIMYPSTSMLRNRNQMQQKYSIYSLVLPLSQPFSMTVQNPPTPSPILFDFLTKLLRILPILTSVEA